MLVSKTIVMSRDRKHHNNAAEKPREQLDNNSGDAQNVADEATQRLGDRDHGLNKANEGARQGRDSGSANKNAERMNDRKGK